MMVSATISANVLNFSKARLHDQIVTISRRSEPNRVSGATTCLKLCV